MIRFGPAGIPLSCKGRTLRDGIEDVHNLGLTAMEVQLVRVNLIERYAEEKEIGKSPREVENELIVEMYRKEKSKETVVSDLDEKIRQGDVLCLLASGIAKDYRELTELGELSKELDVELSLHTPYYMDLTGTDELAIKSMDSIRWGGLLAEEMGATVVVTHLGLYGNLSRKQAMNRVKRNLRSLRESFEEYGIKPRLGLETSGRKEVFGTLDEVITLCREVDGVVPVINFAHVHSRTKGSLREEEDFQKVFEKVSDLVNRHHHTHFSGVEHEDGNELRYTPIKRGDLRFEPLAECILDNDYDVTLISGSPLLEHDAMYMKVIFERVLAKKIAKKEKEEKK